MKKAQFWNLKMTAGWTISLLLITTLAAAQVAPDTYFIKFTDKDNSPYSVSQPQDFLSQRALDRRSNQNIPILAQDLPVTPQYLDSLVSAGATLHYPLKWFNGAIISTQDSVVLQEVLQFPFVDAGSSFKTETSFQGNNDKLEIVKAFKTVAKTDQTSNDLYDYGYAFNQVQMMNVHILHNDGFTGLGMWVAVMDAGFAGVDTIKAFQHIYANNRLIGTRDFVDGGSISYNRHTHGTYVLSCMGAQEEGSVVGTAPEASYLLLRTEDGSQENMIEEFNWVAAAEFGDSIGVDVFNTSLGYTTYDYSQSYTIDDLDGNTSFIVRGADIAASKGILVVNSAGNYGASAWYKIGTPADGDSVLAIGATNASGVLESFSSRGPSADGRYKPNVSAQGGAVAVADFDNEVAFLNGTSFSGPLVAGAATSFWQKYPNKSNMEIFHAIEYSSSRYNWGRDNDYGWGIPNFDNIDFTRTSVKSIRNQPLGDVFPNPAKAHIQIKNLKSVFASINFYSNGQVAMNARVSSNGKLNISHLPNGLYVIEIQDGDEKSFEKLIKQ